MNRNHKINSALCELLNFLDKYPHPAKTAIQAYINDGYEAIDCPDDVVHFETHAKTPGVIVVSEERDKMIEDVVKSLIALGHNKTSATQAVLLASGDSVQDLLSDALRQTTTLKPYRGE